MAFIYGGIFGKIRGCVGPYKFVIDKRGNNFSVARYRHFTPSPAQLRVWSHFALLIRLSSKLYLPWLKPRFIKPRVFYTAIAEMMHENFGRYYKYSDPSFFHNITGSLYPPRGCYNVKPPYSPAEGIRWSVGIGRDPPAGSFVYACRFTLDPFRCIIYPGFVPAEDEFLPLEYPTGMAGVWWYTIVFYDMHTPDIPENWSEFYCYAHRYR